MCDNCEEHKKCLQCGTEFKPEGPDQTLCCLDCFVAYVWFGLDESDDQ